MQARSVNSRSFRNIMLRCKPDLGIVANFGQILSLPLLSIPTHGFINFHPSLLPKYRGPTPLGHILLNAETVAGVTWHKMSPKLDQGAILAQRDFHIRPDDTIRDLDKKAVALAIEMLNPLLASIAQNKLTPIAQDESQASYYAKLTKQEKMRLAQMGKLS
jgi:methionyl-tRNA formyltransferase